MAESRLQSTPEIFLMENHDEAYQVWRRAGVRAKILIHIDAHDDLVWASDQVGINIANFISAALKEDLVKEVFWVVPEQTWQDAKSRRLVKRRLQKVMARYPGKRSPVTVTADQIAGAALGKPLHICPLGRLPRLAEEVLLDIDVDYLVIPRACRASDQYRQLPWCWPEQLVAELQARAVQAELITIAYSVEGGYTPLKWKYLGDELARLLQKNPDKDRDLQGMALMREGALAAAQGSLERAEEKYLQARELLSDYAALDFHLATLYLKIGKIAAARECHRRALALDPSYRTAYSSGGFWYYDDRRYVEAEEEHRRTLALDPDDPYPYLGLGFLAVRERRWLDAGVWLHKALERDEHLVDAHRLLGKALMKQGRGAEAIAAYEKSLQLSLHGYLPLAGPIHTVNETGRLLDPDHFKVHTILGKLYYLQNEIDTAIISFRMGIAAGDNGFVTRIRLARIYLKQRQWAEAAREGWAALQMIPRDVWYSSQRSWHRLQRAAKDGYRQLTGTR